MRRIWIALVAAGCAAMIYFTSMTGYRVFSSDLSVPVPAEEQQHRYRIVLISQEVDTPFWTDVKQSALEAAERENVSLEVWGTFGRNDRDFLNNMEIAIASKVDGIIAQGLDTDEFIQLTKIRATRNGIPVITVANDVPASESLRRTYVGSDHREAGRMIARQLLSDMGFSGKVVLMASERQEDFQTSRLEGILEVFAPYRDIRTEIVTSGDSREQVDRTITDVLNREPQTRAFIAVAASHAGVIVQKIEQRSRVKDYYLYSFDDSPDTTTLLKQGKIDAIIAQSPVDIGSQSIQYMVEWLEGKHLPLRTEGYFTNIRVIKAVEGP